MTDQELLILRCKMEALISEREGMIAENQQRVSTRMSMAYMEEAFFANAEAIRALVEPTSLNSYRLGKEK